MEKKILVIVGPTASGKSDLAVKLAKKLNGEVISADSRQVYKGLNIGSGKITQAEMKGVRHHLLDVADPKKQFNASDYKQLADKAIKDISKRGKLPVVVGGTGFYIDALLGHLSMPGVPANKVLRARLDKLSAEKLFDKLKVKDPARAKTIDRHNKVRLVRALEIVAKLGKVPTNSPPPPSLTVREGLGRVIFIGLRPNQKDLEKRIYKRILKRLPGMIREARKLHSQGLSYKRMEELGLEYRYLARLLQKIINKEEFVEKLNIAIRQYAKRQMTWFKRNKEIEWFTAPPTSRDVATIQKLLAGSKPTLRG